MITKIWVFFVLLSLILGLYPNALVLNFNLYLLDIAVLLSFIQSLFLLRYRIKALDIFLGLFFILNIILLLINFKLLITFSSFLYLFRFMIYFASYPFFIYLYKNYAKFSFKSYIIALYVTILLNLLIFVFFPHLTIKGFDPHKYRLYGQFLDPNYYSVFLCLNLHLVFNFYKSKNKVILILLTIISIVLTLSRLGLLILLLVCLLNFSKKYFWYISLLVIAGSLTVFINPIFLNRILFIEGNFDSFFFRILDFFDGVSIYTKSTLPSGFNNMVTYNIYHTSSINNSSSYYDFWPLNLILSGGMGVVLLFVIFLCYMAQKISLKSIKHGLFIILFSSLGMNILFFPVFLLYLSILLAVGLYSK